MTQEEKAKAYDEAVNKLRRFIEQGVDPLITRADVQDFFPELKESEDEKVRKEIIDFLKLPHPQFVGKRDHEKWIAWLERQGDSSICNIPSKEIILAIWDLGNEWKELTGGSISTEYDTQLNYIQNHWHESEYYLRAMQNEQKLIDKVEPKFEVGDWIINPRTGLIKHIKNVLLCDNNGNYEFESSSMSIDSVDNSFHLWTIQDAKDGDVLYINNTVSESIMIYKSFNNGLIKKYASYNKFGFEGEHYLTLNDGYITPATKEQRNLLFQKMKEAGYEWDARNKAMTKIEQKSTNSYCQENCKGFQETGKCFADGECKAKREAEQNSTWSEEDIFKVQRICKYLDEAKKYYADITEVRECIDWLKSFQDRVQPQPKQEWSEEDSVRLQRIIDFLWYNRKGDTDTIYQQEQDIDWLKSLRPQKCLIPSEEEIEKAAQEWDSKANFNPFYMTTENGKPTGVKQSITTHKESFKAGVNWILKYGVQPKQEWSDVDKDILSRIIDDLKFLRDTVSIDPKYAVSIIDMEREITWLNSLRPQNKWKPSDEQMEALDWQVENTSVSSWQYKATKELMEDLKKLKEE